jgi:WD40 repeat protein
VFRGVLLYGESGAGKSSLLNAGLIPAAEAEGFRADRIRVQPRLGEELVVERIPTTEDSSVLVPSSFAGDGTGSSQIVLSVDEFTAQLASLPDDAPRPLLVFDQFEELVTLFEEAPAEHALEDARKAQRQIVEMLGGILRDETLRAKLLFGFREDYLAKVKKLLELHPELVSQSMRLSPPGTNALPRIIRGPFEDHPGHFEPELSENLARRLTTAIERRSPSGTINLTEVQIVCLRLWESRNPDELLEKRHVRGILEDYLTESLERFPEDLHYPAIALLSQMVTGSGARDVIALVTLVERVRDEEPDISEERLKRSLDALEKETKLVRRERRRDLDLYEISSEFLVPWIARQRQERVKAREQRRLVERAREQRARLMFAFGVIGSLLFLVGVTFGVLALYLWSAARSERDVSRSRELALRAFALLDSQIDPRARIDPEAGVETAFRAYLADHDTVEAQEALRAALVESRRRAVLRTPDGVSTAALSPDGGTIVTGSGDGTIRFWDTATSRAVTKHALETPVNSIAFSPDGALLLVAADDGARLLNSTTFQTLARYARGGSVHNAAFSRDGSLIVTAEEGRARIWGKTGSLMQSLPHRGSVQSAVFNQDGTLVLTAGGDGSARLWDWTRGLVARSFTDPKHLLVLSAALSPDGKRVITGGEDPTVRIWATSTGRVTARLRGHRGIVTSVQFSRDGKLVVTASKDDTVQVWSAKGRHLLTLRGHTAGCDDAFFSNDRRLIVSASDDGTIRLWDAGIGRTAYRVVDTGHPVDGAAFSPDGSLFVTAGADGKATIWDSSSGTRVRTLTGHRGRVESVSFSSDGSLVVTAGGRDVTARVWDTATGRQLRKLTELAAVRTAAFSPDATRVVTSVMDQTAGTGTAFVWDWSTGQRLFRLAHGTVIQSAAFSPDGRFILTSGGLQTKLWDAKGSAIANIMLAAQSTDAAFSADGGRVVVAQDDGSVAIYSVADPQDPRLVTVLLGHNAPVTSASFSPDGKFVATSSKDGEARAWEAQSGRVLNVFRGHEGAVNGAVFSPGPEPVVLTAGEDGTARLFFCQACIDIDSLIRLGHWTSDLHSGRD